MSVPEEVLLRFVQRLTPQMLLLAPRDGESPEVRHPGDNGGRHTCGRGRVSNGSEAAMFYRCLS
ncbi:MAG TPA: hypothetical protein VI542_33915 [Candidatus Tectomicrobia bacterium]